MKEKKGKRKKKEGKKKEEKEGKRKKEKRKNKKEKRNCSFHLVEQHRSPQDQFNAGIC